MVTTYNIADVITNPFWTGLGATWDFWQIVMGSREQKVKAATQWIPVGGFPYGLTQNKPEYQKTYQAPITKTVAEQKKTPEGKAFWEENVLLTTTVTTPGMPDFPSLDEFLKYIPLVIVGIVAILVLPGLFKGGKD